jgi:tetraprenyl-beta-curcumene synthase
MPESNAMEASETDGTIDDPPGIASAALPCGRSTRRNAFHSVIVRPCPACAVARYRIALWEFAAACGSTLGLFMLCALAADRELTDEEATIACGAYFPWICGLHILLDYFIDLAEDRRHGDLNFVAYYRTPDETLARLTHFWRQALAGAVRLSQPAFAATVVYGLLAMYLSDPKTQAPLENKVATALLGTAGSYARLLHRLCRLLRRRGKL